MGAGQLPTDACVPIVSLNNERFFAPLYENKKMSKTPFCLFLMSFVLVTACGEEEDPNAIDITNATFSSLDPSCADHVGSFKSSVRDVARDVTFAGRVSMTAEGGLCTMTSNSIPNHDFNDGAAAFVNSSAEVTKSFTLPASPSAAGTETTGLRYDAGFS